MWEKKQNKTKHKLQNPENILPDNIAMQMI